MRKIQTEKRSEEQEIMDDFLLKSEELRNALDKIAAINRLLGGNKVTLSGLKRLLKEENKNHTFTIVDAGCGNGDMLRMLADYAKKEHYKFLLIGIDANAYTVDYAAKLSEAYPNISYKCMDLFEEDFKKLKYDVVLSTLTLHHFKDEEILEIMRSFYKNSTIGIVINDLERSKTAYRLFQLLCTIFGLNHMSREDGLLSILRGFKKQELIHFSQKLGFRKYNVTWKWAFRYEWIIFKK